MRVSKSKKSINTDFENCISRRKELLHSKKTEEIIEISKITYQDYEYRHKHFWSIIYKSILYMATILTIPYILISDNKPSGLDNYLFLFPIINIAVCIASTIIINSERVRMRANREKLNLLLSSLSEGYRDINIDYFQENGFIKKINRIPISNIVFIIYLLFFIASIIQLFFIFTGKWQYQMAISNFKYC